MDREQISAVDPARSGSDKTAIGITAGLVEEASRRGPIGRCVDWLCGWSFIVAVLVMAFTCDEGNIPDPGEDDF